MSFYDGIDDDMEEVEMTKIPQLEITCNDGAWDTDLGLLVC